jgi:hypothetical protein
MRAPRGIARNARLRHWSGIVAGVDTRRPPSEVRRRGGLYLLRLARRRSMGEETVQGPGDGILGREHCTTALRPPGRVHLKGARGKETKNVALAD